MTTLSWYHKSVTMFWRPMLPAICWAILVLCLYAIPGNEIKSSTFWELFAADKLGHTAIFAVFTVILRVGFKRQRSFPGIAYRSAWISLLVAIVYGGILELVQDIFFEDRTSEYLDFIANTIGAFLGLLLFRIIYGKELSA